MMWAGTPKKRLPRFMGLGDPNQHNESSRGDSIMSASDDPYSKLKQSRDRARIAIATLENSPSHTLTGDVCLHLVRVFYTGQSVPVDMNKAMRFAEQAALHYLRLCGENLACTHSNPSREKCTVVCNLQRFDAATPNVYPPVAPVA
jgi:hypothetical protein